MVWLFCMILQVVCIMLQIHPDLLIKIAINASIINNYMG